MRMRLHSIVLATMAGVAATLCAATASAGVIIQGTRVIFPAEEREVAVRMTNEREHPVLVEAWLETADGKPAAIPFTIAPPLFRIDPEKGQTLRIFQRASNLPKDRESLFWLNVKDVPPQAGDSDNKLKIAYRSRLKMFYRPAGLSMSANEAQQALRWVPGAAGTGLTAVNPTPYFITVTAVQHGESEAVAFDAVMVSPFGEAAVPVAVPVGTALKYTVINDFGSAVAVSGIVTTP